jgi:hypothetical protein
VYSSTLKAMAMVNKRCFLTESVVFAWHKQASSAQRCRVLAWSVRASARLNVAACMMRTSSSDGQVIHTRGKKAS